GNDEIRESGNDSNGDTLVFGFGIDLEDLHFSQVSSDLRIKFIAESAEEAAATSALGLATLTGEILIEDWFTIAEKRVERLAFDNGDSVWIGHFSNFQMHGVGANLITATSGNDFVNTGDGDNEVRLGGGHDTVIGGDGENVIFGEDGNDVLIGGSGRVSLHGGEGNDILDAGGSDGRWNMLRGKNGDDTYIYGRRSGETWIADTAEIADGGFDTLLFSDLTLSDLDISIYTHDSWGDSLKFSWAKGSASGAMYVSYMGQYIERFEFADGTTLSAIGLRVDGRSVLSGTDGDDYIVGTSTGSMIYSLGGNDTIDAGGYTGTDWQLLRGQAGDETYLIGMDDGKVRIDHYSEQSGEGFDTVRFKDLTLSDLTITKIDNPDNVIDGDEIELSWNKDGYSGVLRLAHLGEHIERFEFADGTTLSEISLNTDGEVVLTGTDGADFIVGSSQADVIIGGNGVDILTGGTGDDTFVFTMLNDGVPGQFTPADSVTDFVAGVGTDDVIELSLSHFSDFNDVLMRASENTAEGSVTINVGIDAPLVVLDGVALADLHADDFRFV
ncbi:MAG: hypothetical protein K5905_23875, partial [Roseibium sp.]|uniref:calcium-binding protein n=1 Tax=Roseibium sp. TaxID=1936156 RepID=UPI00260773C9